MDQNPKAGSKSQKWIKIPKMDQIPKNRSKSTKRDQNPKNGSKSKKWIKIQFYLKNPLLSSCSAKLLMLDIKTSSYPKKFCKINLENESPKHES